MPLHCFLKYNWADPFLPKRTLYETRRKRRIGTILPLSSLERQLVTTGTSSKGEQAKFALCTEKKWHLLSRFC